MSELFKLKENRLEGKHKDSSKNAKGSINDLDPEKWREYEEKLNLQFFTIKLSKGRGCNPFFIFISSSGYSGSIRGWHDSPN